MYLSGCFGKLLDEIEYEESDYLFVLPLYGDEYQMTWISLFGKWYTNELYCNESYKLVDSNYASDTKKINLEIGVSIEEIDCIKSNDNNGSVYLINFPYNKEFDYEQVLENFDIEEETIVDYRGWEIQAYKIY